MAHQPENIFGYSGFILDEECYEYNEDACFIAGTKSLAVEFMNNCFHSPGSYRVDPVSLNEVIEDFGCSCGEFAMDTQAFTKFTEVAKRSNLEYEAEDWDSHSSIKIVNILKRKKT